MTDHRPWADLSAVVERRLGLHFPKERLGDLKRGLRGAAAQLGFSSVDELAQRLLSGSTDATAVDALATHLTIGETYFFRGEETFNALANSVLPELIAARRRTGNLHLRIWSAACCTGEEVYSLAILLRQLLPDIGNWQVALLGTDVNPTFLERAAQGEYSQWSFRGRTPAFKARHFQRLPNGRYQVQPELRAMVRFEALNLVEAPLLPDGPPYDLILCRNVLMYFTPPQATRVVAALHARLGRDGWLAVAPCEASQALLGRFEAVHLDGAILYRRGRKETAKPRQPVAKAAAHDTAPLQFRAAPAPIVVPPPPAPEQAAPPPEPVVPDRVPAPAVAAAHARAFADQRRMPEALAWCEQWIAGSKLDPDAHYLHGMILAEMGDPAGACAALERCLYLSPDRLMACFALANLERGRRRAQQASRHYTHLLELLERLPADAAVQDAEGVAAGQLRLLVRDLLTSLRN